MAKPSRIKTKYGYNYRIEIGVSGIRKSGNVETQSEAYRWTEETEHLLRTGQPLPGLSPGSLLAAYAQALCNFLERMPIGAQFSRKITGGFV